LVFSCKILKVELVAENPWDLMQKIENEITVPTFPNRIFNIVQFGAIADGLTDNSAVFKNTISKCSQSGGGIVLVPKGKYFTGAIHLKNNVNLHLEEGAEILFSTNPKDYYPLVHTSFEGIELMNYSPLIYAYKQNNIAVTGKGILNGQAGNNNWWTWKGSAEYGWIPGMPSQLDKSNLPNLMEMAKLGIPVSERIFGENHFLRSSFFEPFECTNVLIQGVKIINAPFWVMHPIKCTNVTVDGVTVESHGPNNDGCDPEYSKNVVIKNCIFNTGDDCIAIKSGRDDDGRRVAIKSENIVIQNCKMIDGHGGVVMGSETSAGVKNVFVENCVMDSPNLDRAIRIKTNSKRGGVTENIYVRNIEIGQVKEAVLRINMFYDAYGNQSGDFIPVVQNIYLENIRVKNGGKYGILAKGYKESPIKNVTLKNVVIEKVKSVYELENVENLIFENTFMNGELIKNSNN
jgi:polygalacturonase